MFSTSIPLGRLAGAPLRLHWSAVLVGVLLGVMLVAGERRAPPPVVVVLAFFASIIGHEAAHAYVARRYGIATTSIDLWALGGMARLEREPRTARAEGWIAAAGPLASLAIGVAGLGAASALLALDAPIELARVVAWVGAVNVLLAVFNLLPGAPLDGGRIVRAVRWGRHGNRYRAMREAGHAGRVIGWAVGGLGLWIVLVQQPERDLPRPHRPVHRHERPRRDRPRRRRRAPRGRHRRPAHVVRDRRGRHATWTPTR